MASERIFRYLEGASPETDDVTCNPPHSRISVSLPSGHPNASTESEVYAVFSQYGPIESIKLLSKKPVAFIKYTKNSHAERAIEELNGRLLNPQDTHLMRVYLAETRAEQGKARLQEASTLAEDDLPPRSRLFVGLGDSPLTEQAFRGLFRSLPGFQSCTLIASKGVGYVKFESASAAAGAVEYFEEHPAPALRRLIFAEPRAAPSRPAAMEGHRVTAAPPAREATPVSRKRPYAPPVPPTASPEVPSVYRVGAPNGRLFIVLGRGANQEEVYSLFAQYPGFLELEFKVDGRGNTKSFAYASYASTGEASAAMDALHGYTLPGSLPLKVLFAEEKRDGKPPLEPVISSPYLSPIAPTQPAAASTHRPTPAPPTSRRPPHAGPASAPPQDMTEYRINDDVPVLASPQGDPEQPPRSRLYYMLPRGCAIPQDTLVSLFRRFYDLEYVQPLVGKYSGYVKYANPESAARAIAELHLMALVDGPLKVVLATPHRHAPSGPNAVLA
jgi:RNA recognition motif-containing protein